ncbi:MAG: kinase [Gammaproteobacteria bacterium]|nr:kinase [Gammaproteobacteria bacterium]MBU1556261.1 kinase [Gammaproteobacteria bacterium]MBU2071764.1 kinase [Gammaproteobacteria bacterium]MBU2181510.1 kinase [Gammaproteobacteria bacterium]MBU2203510.1 kinase [Gammaproteobacteria bacterium]
MADFRSSTQYQNTIAQLVNTLQSGLNLPAVIGISGAQGSGKSTLAAELVAQLQGLGIAAAAVSLDDYYLSKAQRQQLAQTIHPLLAQRGVPGSHDITLAIAQAKALLASQPVALPQFDKALDQPLASIAAQRLDILIVEGWCLGLAPQTAAELATPVNLLEAREDSQGVWRHFVNSQLAGLYAEYWQLLKPLVWLHAPDWHCVCRWRAKQEQQLWQNRGAGMTDAELARFMLPFQRLTLASWQQLPQHADIIISLDQQHNPAHVSIK